VKPIFVPLLSQSMLYIGSMESANLTPGIIGDPVDPRTLLIPRPARSLDASLTLRLFDTQGNEMKFGVSILDTRGMAALAGWLTENASLPGFYTVTQGGDTVTVAAMNMHAAESDGAPIAQQEMLSTVRRFGATPEILSPAASIDAVVLQSRFGVELWKYFLLFALFVAVAEMLVARENRV